MPNSRDTQPIPKISVAIRGSASHGNHCVEGTGDKINGDGMTVTGVQDVDLGPFVWCDIGLPGGDIKALGEVTRRDPLALAIEVRFKHLFPDAKRRLLTVFA